MQQRHFSDAGNSNIHGPALHVNPARLGPPSRRNRIIQERGTMSMPTSPIMRAAELPWDEMPQTAQPGVGMFSLNDAQGIHYHDPFSTSYHNQPYPSSLFSPHGAHGADQNAPGHAGLDQQQHQHHHHQTPLQPLQPLHQPHQPPQSLPFYHSTIPHIPHSATHSEADQSQSLSQGYSHRTDEEDESNGRPRKKRAQVRIACTHCQKACKKCSNMRPCERCVKYGLSDCVDSTRKVRKTGVKRGPYKRRASKYTIGEGDSPQDTDSYNDNNNDANAGGWWSRRPSNVYEQHPPHPAYPTAPVPHNRGHQQGTTVPPPHHPGLPPPQQRGEKIPPPRLPQPQPQQSQQSQQSQQAQQTTTASAATLHDAFAAAMNGPRWINGQRVDDRPSASTSGQQPLSKGERRPSIVTNANPNGRGGGIMMPETPRLPFPLSLHHGGGNDPFSRAVSPIRQLHRAPALGTGSGHAHNRANPPSFLTPHHQNQNRHQHQQVASNLWAPGQNQHRQQPNLPNLDVDMSAPSSPFDHQDYQNHRLSASSANGQFPFGQVLSAPTSPKTQFTQDLILPRSSSAEPIPQHHHHQNQYQFQQSQIHPLLPSHNHQNTLHSPAMIALKRTRRPTLRTLISPLSTAANSRATSPVSGVGVNTMNMNVDSPTLFDQPMSMVMDDVSPISWDSLRRSVPNGNQDDDNGMGDSKVIIKQEHQDGSQGEHDHPSGHMEGLGFGFEGVFQTAAAT